MNKVIIIALLAACVFARLGDITHNDAMQAFKRFKQEHGKKYTSAEHEMARFSVFIENLERIRIFNSNDSAVHSVTQFADLTEEEFVQTFNGYQASAERQAPAYTIEATGLNAPASFSWVDKGAVTPVKNQGSCGSCWAFSTTGAVEGQNVVALGHSLTSFSEQQLVDCDTVHNKGCNGGLMDNAFIYLESSLLETESTYKYTGAQGKCNYNAAAGVVKAKGFVDVSTDETVIASTLAQVGPLSVALNANQLQFYSKGVSNPKICNPNGMNHAVLAVGYGTEGSTPYWLIKNSWGSSWGEQGYFRLYRGNGKCGINKAVSYPILA